MPDIRPRTLRAEPREVLELKQLKARQPELADAVDLQLALLDLQRRVQGRVPMSWVEAAPDWLKQQHEAGRPLLRFEDIPLDWTDFRLVFRQTADVLRRFDAIETADYHAIQSMSRDGHALEPLVVRWFNRAAAPDLVAEDPTPRAPASQEALDQVLALAMRPFLERCADIIQQRADFSTWTHANCPLCGGEPEFAVIVTGGDRLLICGRCAGRWCFDAGVCPFCRNDDRGLLPSFSSRDGLYRLYACDVCKRYVKAYDARQGGRPVMVAVDSIATLPLDAAAIQKGYLG
ncbi:MAG TPA: formate dehydrogenase accessory protein FdhE [Vicinamibacterales bacterium]